MPDEKLRWDDPEACRRRAVNVLLSGLSTLERRAASISLPSATRVRAVEAAAGMFEAEPSIARTSARRARASRSRMPGESTAEAIRS